MTDKIVPVSEAAREVSERAEARFREELPEVAAKLERILDMYRFDSADDRHRAHEIVRIIVSSPEVATPRSGAVPVEREALASSADPTEDDIKALGEAIDACGNDARAGWDWWYNEAEAAWRAALPRIIKRYAVFNREAIARTAFKADMLANASAQIPDGFDFDWAWKEWSTMPISGPSFLRRWYGIADAILALALTPPPALSPAGSASAREEVLREALRRFGNHSQSCACRGEYIWHDARTRERQPCDCGYAAALAQPQDDGVKPGQSEGVRS